MHATNDDAGQLIAHQPGRRPNPTRSRSERYAFRARPLSELKVLRVWLETIGCRTRDTVYRELLAHIAAREQTEARQHAAARRIRRERV